MTTLTSTHDLLAAIPFLVGFEPSDSIVLISLKSDEFNLALRLDFPDSLNKEQLDELVAHLMRNCADAAIAVFYLPETASTSHPTITQINETLSRSPITLRESLIVKDGLWRSLLCEDELCCPPSGNSLPDISASRVAAEQVARGRPFPYKDIKELENSIAANVVDPELLKLISQIPEIDYGKEHIEFQRLGAEAIIDFISDFSADGLCRDKNLIALVLVRLRDLQVRDFALGSVSKETLDIYFNAWRWLLRIAPQGYVAPVANLLAAVAYEKGDGALAHRCLDRAEVDQPAYAMTRLLRQVFNAGWEPAAFAALRAELHPRICDALFSGNMNS